MERRISYPLQEILCLELLCAISLSAQLLPAPTLVSPQNGSVNQPVNVTLAWQTVIAALDYDVQIATDSLFTLSVFRDTTTSTMVGVGPLSYFTVYYWRVRASSLLDSSSWSEVWKFQTIPLPPQAPLLMSPSDGSLGEPTSMT